MRARYFGKQVVRDELGHARARYDPEVEVIFTEREKDLAIKRLDATGFDYDLFGCDDDYDAHVRVRDREDANDFMSAWKEAKRTIKK